MNGGLEGLTSLVCLGYLVGLKVWRSGDLGRPGGQWRPGDLESLRPEGESLTSASAPWGGIGDHLA